MMSVFANEGDSDGYDETCASLERGRMVEKLAMDALEQAVGRGTRLIHCLVFYDSLCSRYTPRAFWHCFEPREIAQSMSRPGDP